MKALVLALGIYVVDVLADLGRHRPAGALYLRGAPWPKRATISSMSGAA